MRKMRNFLAIRAHFRHGGAHTDQKKEANKMACRIEIELPEYDVCNCDEALYLKELLTDAKYELISRFNSKDRPNDLTKLLDEIQTALNKE